MSTEPNQSNVVKPGTSGVWWHSKNPGPIKNLPFIRQFGHMKFTRINLDENMKPHLNDGIEIHYVESGKYDWEIEGKTVELLPDDISITAPWHLNGSPTGKMDLGEINWIVIKPQEFTEKNALKLGKWTKLPAPFQKNLGQMIALKDGIIIRNARNFKRYFLDLKRELSVQDVGYEMIVVNLIENMFIALNRHFENRKQRIQKEDSFIHALTDSVTNDLTKKWIVDELAQEFGMGKTKFTNEVRRLTGYPPNSFIINLKLNKAKELLRDHNKTLSDIAYICGFSSLQHFTSSFSQRTGITPATYKKNKSKTPVTARADSDF